MKGSVVLLRALWREPWRIRPVHCGLCPQLPALASSGSRRPPLLRVIPAGLSPLVSGTVLVLPEGGGSFFLFCTDSGLGSRCFSFLVCPHTSFSQTRPLVPWWLLSRSCAVPKPSPPRHQQVNNPGSCAPTDLIHHVENE